MDAATAARKLTELLNEIEDAGHPVSAGFEGGLWVGNLKISEPPFDDAPWEFIEQ